MYMYIHNTPKLVQIGCHQVDNTEQPTKTNSNGLLGDSGDLENFIKLTNSTDSI